MLDLQAESGPATALGLAVLDGRVRRRLEDVALAIGIGLLRCGVVDLLEHAGHREEERRLEFREQRQQILDVGRVPETSACADAAELDEPAEHVRDGQEQQSRGAGRTEDLVECGDHVVDLEHEVALGEHAALRATGRARGVDERREGVGRERQPSVLELLVRDRCTLALEVVDDAVVEHPHPGAGRDVDRHLVEDGLVAVTLEKDGHRAGVAEDPLHLLCRGGLVDRDAGGAREPDGIVDERPLVAIPGHHGDPLTGLDAIGDDPLRHRLHLIEELGRGDADPLAPALHRQHDGVGRRRGIVEEVIGHVPRDGHRGCCGQGEFCAHCWASFMRRGARASCETTGISRARAARSPHLAWRA